MSCQQGSGLVLGLTPESHQGCLVMMLGSCWQGAMAVLGLTPGICWQGPGGCPDCSSPGWWGRDCCPGTCSLPRSDSCLDTNLLTCRVCCLQRFSLPRRDACLVDCLVVSGHLSEMFFSIPFTHLFSVVMLLSDFSAGDSWISARAFLVTSLVLWLIQTVPYSRL